MMKYVIKIEVQDGEIEKIMNEIDEAQKTIYQCYGKLQNLGVLKIAKKEASEEA